MNIKTNQLSLFDKEIGYSKLTKLGVPLEKLDREVNSQGVSEETSKTVRYPRSGKNPANAPKLAQKGY